MAKNTAALIIGLFLALFTSEIILQILNIPPRPVSGWKNCAEKNPGECNSMGFRGKEIAYSPDDFVVLLVGDSEVYAHAVPYKQMPEKRLEHYLRSHISNVKVFTIGDMGYGQDQQYLSLKKYFKKYRADLVLLMFTERNDVEDNTFPTTGLNNTIKPTFWLENGELKGPTEGLFEPVGPRLKLALIWQRYIGKPMGEALHESWIKDKLPLPYQPQSNYQGEVDYSWNKEWLSDPKNAKKYIGCEKEGFGNQYVPRSEIREYGYQLTRKLFFKIKKLVEAHNGHFIIFKEERPWELHDPTYEKAYFLKGKYYRVSMKQYHENIKELFEGFEHYRIPLNMKKLTASKEDAHLSPEAIDKLMGELAVIVSKKSYCNEIRK